MPTCPELTAMATQIAAPFQHMITGESAAVRVDCAQRSYFPSNDVRSFPAKLPCKVPVSQLMFSDAAQLNVGVALLTLSYTDPAFGSCHAVAAWQTPAGRVQALKPIQAWGSTGKGFTSLSPLSYATQSLLLTILNDPTGSRPGSRMTEVVAAAAEVVRTSKTAFFDAALWVPLWAWAVGGPDGGASARTRSFAMKALEAILRRGTLFPAQIRAADSLAAVLNNIVQTGARALSMSERELYRAEATALLGEVQAALYRLEVAGLAPVPTPVASQPTVPWVPITLGVSAVGLLIGGAILIRRQRTAAVA